MLAAGGQLQEAEKLLRKLLHIVLIDKVLIGKVLIDKVPSSHGRPPPVQGPASLPCAAAQDSLAGCLQAQGKLGEAGELMDRWRSSGTGVQWERW